MRWAFPLLVAVLWIGSAYLLLRYRHAEELRHAARVCEQWDSRRNAPRHATREDLAALPELPRAMIRSECFESGGDTLGQHNCYQSAREWLDSTAVEHEERSFLGYAGVSAAGLLSFFGVWLHRKKRRQLALLE